MEFHYYARFVISKSFCNKNLKTYCVEMNLKIKYSLNVCCEAVLYLEQQVIQMDTTTRVPDYGVPCLFDRSYI